MSREDTDREFENFMSDLSACPSNDQEIDILRELLRDAFALLPEDKAQEFVRTNPYVEEAYEWAGGDDDEDS